MLEDSVALTRQGGPRRDTLQLASSARFFLAQFVLAAVHMMGTARRARIPSSAAEGQIAVDRRARAPLCEHNRFDMMQPSRFSSAGNRRRWRETGNLNRQQRPGAVACARRVKSLPFRPGWRFGVMVIA